MVSPFDYNNADASCVAVTAGGDAPACPWGFAWRTRCLPVWSPYFSTRSFVTARRAQFSYPELAPSFLPYVYACFSGVFLLTATMLSQSEHCNGPTSRAVRDCRVVCLSCCDTSQKKYGGCVEALALTQKTEWWVMCNPQSATVLWPACKGRLCALCSACQHPMLASC